MTNTDEKWETLESSDLIFQTHDDGYVTPCGTRGSAMFGARVRKRNGTWQKQIQPLQILNGPYVGKLYGEGRFSTARDFIAKNP